MQYKLMIFAVLSCLTGWAQATKASIVIDIENSGGNVIATMSGDMDLDAIGTPCGADAWPDRSDPSIGQFALAGVTRAYDANPSITTPYGTGTFTEWDESTGDAILMPGLGGGDGVDFLPGFLGLPLDYVTQQSLSGTATKFGTTVAALGITQGSYVTTFSNGTNSDTITINVVPEPTFFAMFGSIALFGHGSPSSTALVVGRTNQTVQWKIHPSHFSPKPTNDERSHRCEQHPHLAHKSGVSVRRISLSSPSSAITDNHQVRETAYQASPSRASLWFRE